MEYHHGTLAIFQYHDTFHKECMSYSEELEGDTPSIQHIANIVERKTMATPIIGDDSCYMGSSSSKTCNLSTCSSSSSELTTVMEHCCLSRVGSQKQFSPRRASHTAFTLPPIVPSEQRKRRTKSEPIISDATNSSNNSCCKKVHFGKVEIREYKRSLGESSIPTNGGIRTTRKVEQLLINMNCIV